MSDIDAKIRGTLDADDREFLKQLDQGDRGLFTQIGDVLTGPLASWAKLIFAVASVLGVFLLYAAWRFFTSEGGDDLLRWGLILLGGLTMQGFIKEWLYSRMNMLAILRELKRLQLLVAMREEPNT